MILLYRPEYFSDTVVHQVATLPTANTRCFCNTITVYSTMMPPSRMQLKPLFPYLPTVIYGRSGTALFSSKTSTTGHTRLAGRTRFYKHVGTTPISPPWESTNSSLTDSIDSPISAGVDGTRSASGVRLGSPLVSSRNNSSSTTHDIATQSLLHPRHPKTNSILPYGTNTNWFGITLDGKILKTPLGNPLAVPSSILASAIAVEWDMQHTVIQPAQMPLMTLCCTAMDQVPYNRESYQTQIVRYLPTDTTCYWADPTEDRILYKRQQQAYQGLLEYCQTMFQVQPFRAMGTTEGVLLSTTRTRQSTTTTTSSGLPHPPELITRAREWVNTLDAWHLMALHSVVSESKSFLVGMAVVMSSYEDDNDDNHAATSNPFHDLSKAVAASRVEEEFQIDCWGLVEGGHDYDRLNCSVQIHAARFLTGALAMVL